MKYITLILPRAQEIPRTRVGIVLVFRVRVSWTCPLLNTLWSIKVSRGVIQSRVPIVARTLPARPLPSSTLTFTSGTLVSSTLSSNTGHSSTNYSSNEESASIATSNYLERHPVVNEMRVVMGGMFRFVALVLVAVTIFCRHQNRNIPGFSAQEADLVAQLQGARANPPMICGCHRAGTFWCLRLVD